MFVPRSQLDLLVLYQDIVLMCQEADEEEAKMGFAIDGKDKINRAREELAKSIKPQFLGAFNRLHTRYKRPIVPVQNDTCLGCFAKLPTSYFGRSHSENRIFTCEQCGRILFWLE